jgi:TonB family protein
MRTLLLIVTLMLIGPAVAQDFQPHPSHQPPAPPSVPTPPPAAPGFPKPKLLESTPPEYPQSALRFNVEKTCIARLTVNPDGSVRDVEVVNDDGDFAKAVKSAAKSWRFEPRPGESVVTTRVPFTVGADNDYPFDTAVRRMTYAPKEPRELKRKPAVGFAYLRLMIDRAGRVVSRYLDSAEPADFAVTAHMIVDKMTFAPVPPETALEGETTVNEFLVDFASDGVIRVQQRSGEPTR